MIVENLQLTELEVHVLMKILNVKEIVEDRQKEDALRISNMGLYLIMKKLYYYSQK